MDFYQIRTRELKEKQLELFPDFVVRRSEDLMVQGGKFYAIWDPEKNLWSKDEYDVQRLVDEELAQEKERLQQETGQKYTVKYMRSFNSNSWAQFRKFMAFISDNNKLLDRNLTFANDEVSKTNYVSKRLPYAIGEGDISAWDELISTLYSPEQRAKIEWAIGSIISGDSKTIQKFFVFYGPPGTGKSTILNVIQALFEGYTTTFDGKALGSSNASFATEVFRHNPLVALQHDGDLSKLEDNARISSIIAHEAMTMNEKYKPSYSSRVDAMLFIGSNQPVRISDAKSGIIRRLIDIHPTGIKFAPKHYQTLMTQIGFELGAIAEHCLSVYLSMGKNYYNTYRPLEMMLQTDVFFNFIEAHFDVFKAQNYTTLKQAYLLYKEYCSESGIERPLPQYKMREELRNYFEEFKDRAELDGEPVRSLYQGFTANKFKVQKEDPTVFSLVLEEKVSLLDELFADCPAQLANTDGMPAKRWTNVATKLVDIDSRKIHYVQIPENHVVIDFDLKDQNGLKALERNLEAASQWPATYAEISRSGSGIHLHYIYTGDVSELSSMFAEGVEIKTYPGDAALRRRLSRCNQVPVAKISSGLPLKERKDKMLKAKTIQSEQGLRELIQRNLRKEIHPGTKPSVDFIKKILDDAYESGIQYDVTDLRSKILAFANNSSNQASVALKVVKDMKWASENVAEIKEETFTAEPSAKATDERLVFFDVEVYPNLFVVCWKFKDAEEVAKLVNPKPHEVEQLFGLKLVGFYNRRYDNHILYAAAMGAPPEELFRLSTKLVVDGNRSATFAQAYNLSYADIWEFSSVKQSLKKFEIDLGILHMELDLPWDQPVDEKDWERVVEYCANDVRATEIVFEDRKGDYVARQILAELSGLTVNDTTQTLTAKIIFGDKVKTAYKEFVYTDLSKEFPGYKFELGKSYYKDEEPGEGGYVYAEPGMYENVAVLDIVSMHPTSIEILNLFGPYTKNFSDLKKARVAIKHRDFDNARKMLDHRLAPFLEPISDLGDVENPDALAYALKIVVNTVYGLTSAKFDNPFRDIRNIDNIVAKRGALFMIDLKNDLQKYGHQVIHIKTDSVKIPNAKQQTITDVMTIGSMYGYEFEHETTYDKFCLVNDAVYVAGIQTVPWESGPKYQWTAVGAQFQHPYVFKTLFSGEELHFEDYCEARSVIKGTMYIYTGPEKPVNGVLSGDKALFRHVGRTGLFVPVESGGGALYRVYEDKYYAVSGTKGHLWMEADIAIEAGESDALQIDMSYFEKLRSNAVKAIEQFGPFEEFVT